MLTKKKILIILIIAVLVIIVQKLDIDLIIKQSLDTGQIRGVIEKLDNQLRVVFFDLGEADSIFIKTPDKKQILIDGGEDKAILEKLNEQMNWSDNYIDLVVSTHPHADHLGGLIEVLKKYQVGQVWLTGVAYSSYSYLEFLNLLKEKNISTRIIYNCQTTQADLAKTVLNINNLNELPKTHCLDELYINPQTNLKILHPLKNLKNKRIDNLNNSSIVIKLNYRQISFLFMGDAEIPSEQKILKVFKPQILKANVLKIAHQGSSDASSQKFLQAVRPQYAVIFVGSDNPYGHPSLRIIRRLERMGIKIFRTDQYGDIKFVSDGRRVNLFK